MSIPPLSLSEPSIVARLRAAGCVFAEDEARLLVAAADGSAELELTVSRRVSGVPLEHVLGWVEFCGRRFEVEAGVFVPRRRTEFLVDEAVALARQVPGRAVVVDLCCGCGAVGAAVAAQVDEIDLHAADIDPVAVRCARRNLAAVGGVVHEGDLDVPLPRSLLGGVDVLVANVPYVPTDAVELMPPEARVHEARVALDGGQDGLDVARRLASIAPQWLRPGGHLLIESSERQAPTAAAIFSEHGLLPRVATSAELYSTVVVGSRPG